MAAIQDSQLHIQVEDQLRLNDVQSVSIASLYLCQYYHGSHFVISGKG